MKNFNDCPICNGRKYHWINDNKKCNKHNVCDICGKNRFDLQDTPWATEEGFICKPCHEKKCQSYIDEFQKSEHEQHEFHWNSKIKCPYCGYDNDQSDTYESTDDFECEQCCSIFSVEVDFTVEYRTSKNYNQGNQ